MNAQFPFRVLNVAKRELHLGFCAVRPGEEVVPHCHGRWAIDDHLLIFEPYIGPMYDSRIRRYASMPQRLQAYARIGRTANPCGQANRVRG